MVVTLSKYKDVGTSKSALGGHNSPKKGSRQWAKDEKTINSNPVLKKLRDKSQGLEKPDRHYGQTHGGKGSATRTDTHTKEWQDAYDQIDWTANRNAKKSYRVKINGKYVDD